MYLFYEHLKSVNVLGGQSFNQVTQMCLKICIFICVLMMYEWVWNDMKVSK